LRIVDWDTPQITKNDEVIIRVKAFGLNFADTSARKGQYNEAPPFPFVPG
jgi:NADPH2:quinone reductase